MLDFPLIHLPLKHCRNWAVKYVLLEVNACAGLTFEFSTSKKGYMSIALSAVRTLSSVEKSCTAKKRHATAARHIQTEVERRWNWDWKGGREDGWVGGSETHTRAHREREKENEPSNQERRERSHRSKGEGEKQRAWKWLTKFEGI